MTRRNPRFDDQGLRIAVAMWYMAADQAALSRKVMEAKPNRLPGHGPLAIIMAATCAEAFINELAHDLAELREWERVPDHLQQLGRQLLELESKRVQPNEKYMLASEMLPGGAFEKGAAPYQDFANMLRLRNGLVHPKPGTVPDIVAKFMEMGFARNRPNDERQLIGWFWQIDTPSVAAWACRAVRNMIWDLMQRLQDEAPHEHWHVVSPSYQQWEQTLEDSRVKPLTK